MKVVISWIMCCSVVQILLGCMVIPATDTAENSSFSRWRLVNTTELITLQSLLKYAQDLPNLSQDMRLAQYEDLSAQIELDQQASISQRVRLALLVAGTEPSLVDYELARQQLVLAYQQATAANTPLLADFVALQTQAVDQRETLGKAEQEVQKLEKQYRRQLAINRRQRATTAIQSDADAEKDYLNLMAMPPVALADLEWQLQVQQKLNAELGVVQEQLKQREAIIDEQEKMIAVLEAKIKALSAIERNINQRTQSE